MTKDIYMGLLSPWGKPLLEKTLENWSDVDINEFIEWHQFYVYSSKQESKGRYDFKLIRKNTYLALRDQIKKTNTEVNKLKNITLIGWFTNQQQKLSLDHSFTLDTPFIDMKKYLRDNEEEILIVNKNTSKNTLIDLTHITPYIILFFDDLLRFTGATYSLQNENASFRITTPFKYYLFVRHPHEINLKEVRFISFD